MQRPETKVFKKAAEKKLAEKSPQKKSQQKKSQRKKVSGKKSVEKSQQKKSQQKKVSRMGGTLTPPTFRNDNGFAKPQKITIKYTQPAHTSSFGS